MKIHPSQIGPAAAAALVLTAGATDVSAQDALTSIHESIVERELLNPGETPGRRQGERRDNKKESEAGGENRGRDVTDEPEPRSWFGGAPWRAWEQATGDWGGARTWLEERGLSLAGSYTLDWSSVWEGGIANVASTRSMLDLNATADFEKLLGLADASMFVDFQSSDMRGGSRDAGDLHGIDDIETGDNVDQIAELWYQQWLFDRRLRIKLGKIDANLEFGFPLYTNEFIVSSEGTPPTQYLTMPTWPNPAMGAVAFVYPTEQLYLGAGFFDGGSAAGRNTGRLGPRELWHGDEFYWTGEGGVTWKDLASLGTGRLALGAWYHTGDFEQFDGEVRDGTYGFYAFFEQQLTRRDGADDTEDPKGLFAMVQYDHGEEDVNPIVDHLGAGLVARGTFGGRDDDSAGVYWSWLNLSDAEGAEFENDEYLMEAFYAVQVTGWFSVKPSIQYIWNPGGDPEIDDALVGAVRFEVSF